LDVSAEVTAVRSRKREIDKYVEEVERQLEDGRQALRSAAEAEAEARRRLDEQLTNSLAPFLAERDDLIRRRERLAAETREVENQLALYEGLSRRESEVADIARRIENLQERIKQMEGERPSKEALLSDLSARFKSILEEFGFPKLNDPSPPFIDREFVPHVRGNPYRHIGFQ
jgi:chromosome segregation ATPase